MRALRNLFANFIRRIVPQEAILPIICGPLRGVKWVIHSGVLSYWLGVYEKKVQREFKRFIKEGDVVFDIGAHVGFYTLLASRLVGSKGKVFAFEPNPKNIYYLERHVKINSCHNVTIVEAAVSNIEGQKDFYESESSVVGGLCPLGFSPVAKTSVSVIALDLELGRNKILPPRILKIDVEGEEYRVLKGAEYILKTHFPTIILSLHGKELAISCIKLLRSLGYDIFSLDGKTFENMDGGEIVANHKNL